MAPEIVVAVITSLASIVAAFIAAYSASSRSTKTMIASQTQMVNDVNVSNEVLKTQLEDLTREVRHHNDFATRIPKVEARLDANDREIRQVKDDINSIRTHLINK